MARGWVHPVESKKCFFIWNMGARIWRLPASRVGSVLCIQKRQRGMNKIRGSWGKLERQKKGKRGREREIDGEIQWEKQGRKQG